MITLILSSILAYVPIVDGSRVDLDYVTDMPYHLAISEPLVSTSDVYITGYDFEIDMHDFTGYYEIGMVETPLYFFRDGEYIGQITPEPSSLLCLLTGAFVMKGIKRLNIRTH